jgi:mannose-6-phosphate isomerase-like protein (cupin superfamily)
MRRLFLKRSAAILGACWAGLGRFAGLPAALAAAQPASPQTAAAEKKPMEVYEMADLLKQREKSGRAYLPFLTVPALRCGVYVLAAGAVDPQKPHQEDEVYYVESGEAMFTAGGRDQAVKPGSIIYVAAGVEHRFHSISSDLKVLVFFSSAKPG